jgi:hypothetical protein
MGDKKREFFFLPFHLRFLEFKCEWISIDVLSLHVFHDIKFVLRIMDFFKTQKGNDSPLHNSQSLFRANFCSTYASTEQQMA